MKISVIIPTYNEIENIEVILEKVSSVLSSNEFEIIVVDDNSPDGTWKAVERLSRNDSSVKLIRRMNEKGLASALHAGIQGSTGEIVGWLDCDMQHPPEKLTELKAAIETGFDVASASRFCQTAGISGDARVRDKKGVFITRFHGVLSRIVNYSISLLCRSRITDWTSGMVAFRRSALDQLTFRGDHGEYLMLLLYQAEIRKMKIIEIPYVLHVRERGNSKSSDTYFGLYRLGLKYLGAASRLFIYSLHKDWLANMPPVKKSHESSEKNRKF